jgi:hypothetical protein
MTGPEAAVRTGPTRLGGHERYGDNAVLFPVFGFKPAGDGIAVLS